MTEPNEIRPYMYAPTFVYYLVDRDGFLVYVGVAFDPQRRIAVHRTQSAWWPEVDSQRCELYRNRRDALVAEAWAIRRFRPRGNRQIRESLANRPRPKPLTEPVVCWGDAHATA